MLVFCFDVAQLDIEDACIVTEQTILRLLAGFRFSTNFVNDALYSCEILPDFGFQAAVPGATIDDLSRKLQGIGMSAVRRRFSPEFVNRIDQIVTYRPLEMESFAAIVDHEIENLQSHVDNRLGTKAFDLEVGMEARQWLLETGTSLEFGARELKRVIHRNLTQPLAAMVSRGQVPSGCVLRVEIDRKSVV